MRDDDCLAAGLPRRGTPFNFRDNAGQILLLPFSARPTIADQRSFPMERYLCLFETFAGEFPANKREVGGREGGESFADETQADRRRYSSIFLASISIVVYLSSSGGDVCLLNSCCSPVHAVFYILESLVSPDK